MRTALWALASIVVIGAIIILVGPLLISTTAVRDKAFAKVEAETGYRLRVTGPVRISLFPSIDLVADDVGIAQTASGNAAEFVTAKRLRLGLVLRALLNGKVQMTDVTLVDPVIELPDSSNAKGGEIRSDGEAGPAANPLRNLNLHRLVIKNGTVILAGSRDLPGKRIEALTLDASLPTARGQLSFDVKARYEGQPVHVAGSIASFSQFLDGGPAPIRLAIDAPAILAAKTAVTGSVTYNDKADILTLDVQAGLEGQPIRVAGSIGNAGHVLAGGAASITLAIDAPAYLTAKAILSGIAVYKDDTLALTEFSADFGPHTLAGSVTYKDKDDLLTLDVQTVFEGQPVHVAGSIGNVGHVLAGGAAPIRLAIDAPAYLRAQASLAGTAAYQHGRLSLTEFTAESGADTLAGSATYNTDGDVLTLDLQAKYEGQPVHVAGSIVSFADLLDGGSAPVKLAIDAPAHLPAEATLAGTAAYSDDTLTLTEFTAEAAAYALSGNGTYKDHTLTLNAITATTNGQTVTGTLTADLAGNVPSIGASLSARTLDLNRLLANGGDATSSSAGGGGAIGERASGTSDARIDFSPLRTINANFKLDIGQLVHDTIKIDSATIQAKLSGGKLDAEILSLKLYNGTGTGTLTLDASGAVPTQHIRLSLADLDAYPFLNDAAEFQSIEGKAAIDVDLTASGDSERAMVSSLNGTAKLAFADGAIRGLNVANMLRNLTTGILTGWQYNEEATTDFSALGASFKSTNGQAETDDLRLVGPLVSMGGAGTVDLPAQTLKFRVNPLMLASVDGGGGKNRLLGFPVPVAISGPWAKPLFYPDIVGILDHPVAAYEQLNKLGGGLIALPANLIGIDTGGKGLVETGVALPGALAKGAIKGVGAIVGTKQPDDAAPAETAVQEAPAAEGDGVAATDAQPAPQAELGPDPAPRGADDIQQPADKAPLAETNALQAPAPDSGTAEANSEPKSAPAATANPLGQNSFNN